jgi:uncharacterized OsmC-like protein
MDPADLRALQAPVKQRYRAEPEAAATPISASARWDDDGITTSVDGWAGSVRAGLHPATGGDGSDACSAEMLLQALIGCVGVTMRSVATAMGLSISSAQFDARATFDARGTLGIDRSVPVGVSTIEVIATLATDADDAALNRLAETTERYCVVAQSLATPPTLTIVRAPS